jgi:hypothetical protein
MCLGSGQTLAGQRLLEISELILESAEESIAGVARTTILDRGVYQRTFGRVPSSDVAELAAGLVGHPAGPLGYGSCSVLMVAKKIAQAAGLPAEWGRCPECGGTGVAKEGAES